jgi:predicted TIM-barrel fold metal-dependent hydrolase
MLRLVVDAYESALELLAQQAREIGRLLPDGAEVVDAHTHLGLDEDGRSYSLEQHLTEMARNNISRACVFALNEPDREPAYRKPNDRILKWAGESDGKLIPYVRLSLEQEPLAEAERCVELGAKGIKLHPRAQAFRVNDKRLEDVFAFADERRLPVLIHAGRGLPPGMAEELAHVADRHSGASLILAHAAIVDQAGIAKFANQHPNIYFDTSTWTPLDVLALFSKVGPEQVVYASDVPYGDHLSSQHLLLRLMAKADLPEDVRRGVMGETVLGLVEGRRPEKISPPIVGPTLEVAYDHMRVHNYIAAATPMLWAGRPDMIGFLGLAAGACRDGDGSLAPVGELIVGAETAWRHSLEADDQPTMERRRRAAFDLLNVAQSRALFT